MEKHIRASLLNKWLAEPMLNGELEALSTALNKRTLRFFLTFNKFATLERNESF